MERLSQISYYLRESPMLAAGLCMILLVLMFGVLGPIFVDTSKAQPLATTPRLEPSWEHPFGTDDSGRDLLSVMVVGVPLTMRIGLLAGTWAWVWAFFSASPAAIWAVKSTPRFAARSIRC